MEAHKLPLYSSLPVPQEGQSWAHATSDGAPTEYAAIVGGCMKSIASWKIQTRQGATIGLVEQFMGSQTIARAFTTQIQLRTLNFLGLFIVLLWSLSPIGSQASLRVISVEPNLSSFRSTLKSMNTFADYSYGNAEGIAEAETIVAGPVIASLLAGNILGTRNQDLWGNIRMPRIEDLNETHSPGWLNVPESDKVTYSSLVGIPVNMIPEAGNTSFVLPGSYLSLSCPHFGSRQVGYTNYSSPDIPSPGNGDYGWESSRTGQYQLSMSVPLREFTGSLVAETRNARKLIWESRLDDLTTISRIECDMTTTYVESNVICTGGSGGSSGSSSGSICGVSAIRYNETAIGRNWTTFDAAFPFDPQSVLMLITQLFPYSELSGGVEPVISYINNPLMPLGNFGDMQINVDRSKFESRLAQILNAVLYLGINPLAFAGAFNSSDTQQQEEMIDVDGTTVVSSDVIRCNEAWFAVLVLVSLVIFVCALAGAILRLMTIAPDVLGSLSVAFLYNRLDGLAGSSTWSSSEWARELKDARVRLADVNPEGEIGCIALASLTAHGFSDSQAIEKERVYL
ncbi:hypothetical protein F4808DRAFT_439220 [Astrocystis sublimbata]|nr:hypothetical protein F4808DRAFT_439220 [Astrocystis sublimbata]